jgi:outer membrane receptor protein involved in Fe transport
MSQAQSPTQAIDTVHRRDTAATDSMARRHRSSRLEQITITGAPISRSEPQTVIHIDTATLSAMPANSPWELLRATAGLEVHEQGQGPGFASNLAIRGFSSDHSTDMALYIDGVPNNEPVNGHAEGYNDLNLLFPQIVTGIDVIKGPTSALYGNFAYGGAVNVRTLDRYQGYNIGIGGGSFGNVTGYGIVGFDRGSTGAVLAIQSLREDGWLAHSENQYGHLHAAMTHMLSAMTTISGSVDGYLTSYDSPGFIDTTLYNAHQYNFVSNFGDGGFKRHAQERISLQTFFNSAWEWRTTLYSQQGTWQFWLSTPPGLGGLTEGGGAQTREYDSRYGFGGTTALAYTGQDLDVILGTDTRYTHARYQNYAERSTGFRIDSAAQKIASPAQQLSGGLFVQSGFNVTRYARVNLGGRVDQLSSAVRQPVGLSGDSLTTFFNAQHSKGIFSPKMGILLRPLADLGQPGIGLFGNVSRGFLQTDGVINDPTLPFQTAWSYETGIKLDEGTVSVGASLFRMDVSNEQSFDPVLNETIGGGQSRRTGVDVSARATMIPGVTAMTDFTILHAYYTQFVNEDMVDGNPASLASANFRGEPIFNTSRYTGTAVVDVKLPGRLWFGQLGVNVQGPYTPFEEKGVLRPGYALFNLSGGVRIFNSAEIWLGVHNLASTNYRELESGGQVTPGQSRTVYALLRYRVGMERDVMR